MPNWCNNELHVTGNEKDILKFKKLAKGKDDDKETDLDFNNFIPYPESFNRLDDIRRKQDKVRQIKIDKLISGGMNEETARQKAYTRYPMIKDGYNSGGYEWCCRNWGTKWNPCEVEESDDNNPNELHYSFDTAWSPPIPVIQKMAEMFPLLKFELEYEEGGMGFQGELICADGKVITDKDWEFVPEED